MVVPGNDARMKNNQTQGGTAMATTTSTQHSHMVDGKAEPCSRPVFGPFGDKALHGSKLAYRKAESNPEKRDKEDVLKHDKWCFSYWTPANVAEAGAYLKAKPDNAMTSIDSALATDARQDSWTANRGGSVTVDVTVNGGPVKKRQAVEIVELLKAAGHKVVVIPRTSKE